MITAIFAAYVAYTWMDADDFVRSNYRRLYRDTVLMKPNEPIHFWDFEGLLLLWIFFAPLWQIWKRIVG